MNPRDGPPGARYAVSGDSREVEVEVWVVDAEAGRYRVRVGGRAYDVGWTPALGGTHWWLEWDGRAQIVAVEPEGEAAGVTFSLDHFDLRVAPASPLAKKQKGQGGGAQAVEVRAPMPGLLVAVEVVAGQAVGAGATVAVIEAMKMQMELRAPTAGIVREVRRTSGREVGAGEVVAVLVPDDGGAST